MPLASSGGDQHGLQSINPLNKYHYPLQHKEAMPEKEKDENLLRKLLAPLQNQINNFLQDKWNKLKEKLGIKISNKLKKSEKIKKSVLQNLEVLQIFTFGESYTVYNH